MNLLISNLVSLNGGDAAIAFGMMKAISAGFGSDVSFIIGDSNPSVASSLYPGYQFTRTLGLQAVNTRNIRFLGRYLRKLKVARYRLACSLLDSKDTLANWSIGKESYETMRKYKESAAIISCGGTYLRQDYGVTSQLADYTLSMELGKPIVFYTQSIGAFSDPTTRKSLSAVFSKASAIFVRDNESLKNLMDIGVDQNKIQIRSDAAFALADPGILEMSKKRRLPKDRPLKIAISVRKWNHFVGKDASTGNTEYADTIAGAVTWLVGSFDAQVVFISTCQGITGYDDDSIFANQIADRLDPVVRKNVVVTTDRLNHVQIMSYLADCDWTLGTRMHMCILSLLAGTPVIPIAYEFKTTELFSGMGFGDVPLDMEHLTKNQLISAMDMFMETIDARRDSLFDAVKAEYENAMETGHILVSMLKGGKQS